MFLKFMTILNAFVFKIIFKYSTPVSKYLPTDNISGLSNCVSNVKELTKNILHMIKGLISIFDNIYNDILAFATCVKDFSTQNNYIFTKQNNFKI